MLKQLYKSQIPLTPQDVLSTHRNIQERSRHITCNIKQNYTKRGLKLNLRERRNWSVQIEELAARITPTVSVLLQSNYQRKKTHIEKLENFSKVVSRWIVYLNIMIFFIIILFILDPFIIKNNW